MKANDQIVLRYADAAGARAEGANPNGALDDIAGVCNEARNVFGMMPHPENSVEADLAGGADGRKLWSDQVRAGVNAPPVTYTVNGRQFVAVAAGGNVLFGFKTGDELVAYALPSP
jgi:hypothetical protein